MSDTRGIQPRLRTGVVITNITSPNATDLATSQTLANEIKVDLNLLLDALRTRGIIS